MDCAVYTSVDIYEPLQGALARALFTDGKAFRMWWDTFMADVEDLQGKLSG
jgi:hypothetical protein